jgi:hypothetical protein
MTIEERANVAYACNQAEKFASDTRKMIAATEEICEKLVCLAWAQDINNTGEPVRTEYVTATPDVKPCAKVPKFDKEPDKYAALMRWLGIDPVLWDCGEVLTENGQQDTEVVRVHWPGFQALVGRLASAGYPLPDGIDPNATYMLYSLRYKKRKELPDIQPE